MCLCRCLLAQPVCSFLIVRFYLMVRRTTRITLFPYTALFRAVWILISRSWVRFRVAPDFFMMRRDSAHLVGTYRRCHVFVSLLVSTASVFLSDGKVLLNGSASYEIYTISLHGGLLSCLDTNQ